MISERKRIADRHRSEGQGKSAEIRGKKERELKVIESEAYRKTPGDHGPRPTPRRPAIYAAAYNRDRELYRFVRTHGHVPRRPSTRTAGWCCRPTPSLFRYMQSAGGGAGAGRAKSRKP